MPSATGIDLVRLGYRVSEHVAGPKATHIQPRTFSWMARIPLLASRARDVPKARAERQEARNVLLEVLFDSLRLGQVLDDNYRADYCAISPT
jgi:hypothetical protein